MHLIKKLFLLATCYLLLATTSRAQDSSHIRISLLTCSPGEEIYSTFGHSALRVTDSIAKADIVFNYGTFDFDDPNFYGKFIRGKLLYYISAEYYDSFKVDYQRDNRGIIEQVLNFSPEEKIIIEGALYDNLREENKYYKYDFFFDNCTTRLRDLIVRYKHPTPVLKAAMPEGTRFRQAIHEYLDSAHQYWSELFIDVCLGVHTDAVMTPQQSMFLPDNLMRSLAKDPQLVIATNNLFPTTKEEDNYSVFTPTVVFSLLFGFILVVGFYRNKVTNTFLRIFDGLLFFVTGLLGCMLLFMWFGTDHILCKDNYNLLWALPTNLAVASFGIYRRKWMKVYFAFLAVGLTALLGAWFFLPEAMNNALIPIILLLICRSIYKFFEPTKPRTLVHH
jgi:uncharacterized protein DUF4105